MDAIFMSSAAEKSVYPNKQIKNIPWRNNSCGANFISNPNENPAHRSFIHGGGDLLFAPPSSYHPLLNPLMYQINYQQQQPPHLPLPLPNKQPLHSSVPYRTRSLSSSPSNVKNNRNKDQSLTPKRSKSKQLNGKFIGDQPKKLQLKPITEATKTQAGNEPFVMPSAKALGPHPNEINPKVAKDLDWPSSSIFTLSPPPSSLPLPSFSLRPKLSCNAQAASVDNGAATDNLRRFRRLP